LKVATWEMKVATWEMKIAIACEDSVTGPGLCRDRADMRAASRPVPAARPPWRGTSPTAPRGRSACALHLRFQRQPGCSGSTLPPALVEIPGAGRGSWARGSTAAVGAVPDRSAHARRADMSHGGQQVRIGPRLCENVHEPRMRRIVFSIPFSRRWLPALLVLKSTEIETEFLRAN
jgi:hypothetical protein